MSVGVVQILSKFEGGDGKDGITRHTLRIVDPRYKLSSFNDSDQGDFISFLWVTVQVRHFSSKTRGVCMVVAKCFPQLHTNRSANLLQPPKRLQSLGL